MTELERDQLLADSDQIRDEVTPDANTETRVGTLFRNIVNFAYSAWLGITDETTHLLTPKEIREGAGIETKLITSQEALEQIEEEVEPIDTNYFEDTSEGYRPIKITALATSGTEIKFDRYRSYGSVIAPVTGNVTVSLENADPYAKVYMIHKNDTEPTFATNLKRTESSDAYSTTLYNVITFQFIDDANIKYSIEAVDFEIAVEIEFALQTPDPALSGNAVGLGWSDDLVVITGSSNNRVNRSTTGNIDDWSTNSLSSSLVYRPLHSKNVNNYWVFARSNDGVGATRVARSVGGTGSLTYTIDTPDHRWNYGDSIDGLMVLVGGRASNNGGIARSTDDGATWASPTTQLNNSLYLYACKIANGRVVVGGTRSGDWNKLGVSTDNAVNFSEVDMSAITRDGLNVSSIEYTGTNFIVACNGLTQSERILRFSDTMGSMEQLSAPNDGTNMQLLYFADKLYLLTNSGTDTQIYESSNNGTSWSLVHSEEDILFAWMAPLPNGKIIVTKSTTGQEQLISNVISV
jgi:hypothetical protein